MSPTYEQNKKHIYKYRETHAEAFQKYNNAYCKKYNEEIKAPMIKSAEFIAANTLVLETDAILDKISKYGIDSITDEERNYLDNIEL